MTNEVPISDVVISAVPPPSAPAPAPAPVPAPAPAPAPHSTKRKLDAMGETEGNSMEPAKQLPRSESSTVQMNSNELHSISLNNDNKPIISGMAPVADTTSTSTTTTSNDAVINITDDGTEGQSETQSTSSVTDKILFGFDRVLDAAQYPVDQIKSAGTFVGEGVVKVAEEVVDTVKDGLAVAGLGATVVKDALVEVAVQTNLALQENFGKAVAAGELAVEKAEEKIVHLSEVVTGHPTPNPVSSTSTTQPTGASTETANLANTNTTLQPDQGITGTPATTVKPGLSTSSTFSQQHDAASQWHAEAEKHQNIV